MSTAYEAYFRGKRITILGLGLLGRGVGDVRFLAQLGAEIIVTDLKDATSLRPSLDKLAEFNNIRYVLGKHELADFRNRDMVIYAAGVSKESPYIAEARQNNIPVYMSSALFARFASKEGARIIGITGTRGKSTTTGLVASILRKANKDVLLGGNVRGVSTLAMLPEVKPETYIVLELDSWQLQGFNEESLSPHVAVFTTFYPDHLNYYQGDMQVYLRDKAAIFLHQSSSDTLVLGQQVAPIVASEYGSTIVSKIIIAYSKNVPKDWKLRVEGDHNRLNIACAIAAAKALNIAENHIRAACEEFAGVPGRLELLQNARGVRIFNDTTATTPEATMAGLLALKKKRIILIMGGADKGLDMSKLIKEIPNFCKKVILLAGSGTEKIKQLIPDARVCNTLEAAVREAIGNAVKGDDILFSPAFASFGMFKNEYDRGDQFVHIVNTLA